MTIEEIKNLGFEFENGNVVFYTILNNGSSSIITKSFEPLEIFERTINSEEVIYKNYTEAKNARQNR